MAKGAVRAKLRDTAKDAKTKAGDAIKQASGPSPNPMTNLIISDIVMRGSGRLMRHALEKSLLGAKYDKDKARDIVKGRSMAQTLVGTALARMATRSVPGALIVGGSLLAKTLYDRSKDRRAAKIEGEKDIAEQARRAKS